MPPTAVPIENVRRLLDRWFPEAQAGVEQMVGGVSTPVYRITIGMDVTYLRLAEHPGERRDAEVQVHRLARRIGISVPEIRRYEPHPPELDRSATLTSAITGIPLNGFLSDHVPALVAAAKDLAALNQIPVIGFGWINSVDSETGDLIAEHSTRNVWAQEYVAAAASIVEAKVLTQGTNLLLTTAIDAWSQLPGTTRSHLVHGDFDPSHIYVDSSTGAYEGLIDFGEVRGADLVYDLGHLLAHAFDPAEQAGTAALITFYRQHVPVIPREITLQAIAITTRAIALQITRPPNLYRANLLSRLQDLLQTMELNGDPYTLEGTHHD